MVAQTAAAQRETVQRETAMRETEKLAVAEMVTAEQAVATWAAVKLAAAEAGKEARTVARGVCTSILLPLPLGSRSPQIPICQTFGPSDSCP